MEWIVALIKVAGVWAAAVVTIMLPLWLLDFSDWVKQNIALVYIILGIVWVIIGSIFFGDIPATREYRL